MTEDEGIRMTLGPDGLELPCHICEERLAGPQPLTVGKHLVIVHAACEAALRDWPSEIGDHDNT